MVLKRAKFNRQSVSQSVSPLSLSRGTSYTYFQLNSSPQECFYKSHICNYSTITQYLDINSGQRSALKNQKLFATMCVKVLLHINELGVHLHSRHMYMLKNYFFPLSLAFRKKKKKGFFKIVVKPSTQTIHIKKETSTNLTALIQLTVSAAPMMSLRWNIAGGRERVCIHMV